MNNIRRNAFFSATALVGLAAANQGKFGKAEVALHGDYCRVVVMQHGLLQKVRAYDPPLSPSLYNMTTLALFGDPTPGYVSPYYVRPVHVTWTDPSGRNRSDEVSYV